MAISETELREAEARSETARAAGHAVAVRHDRHRGRIVVRLNTDVELTFPVRLAEGLATATAEELAEIEISPTGLGLHWPRLDVDLSVPGLLQGVFGSRSWIAAQIGSEGGKARSEAKAAAARENGRKGGRPRRIGVNEPRS